MGNDDFFDDPGFCVAVPLVNVHRTHKGFQGISKNLAGLEGIVVFIERSDFFQPHLDGDIIQHLPVYHLASHLGKKAFPFVGIFHEKIVCNNSSQNGISQVFQPFVVF